MSKSKKITTKNGGNMYFVTLEDETGSVEVVFFPQTGFPVRRLFFSQAGDLEAVDLLDNGERKIIAEELIGYRRKENNISNCKAVNSRERRYP